MKKILPTLTAYCACCIFACKAIYDHLTSISLTLIILYFFIQTFTNSGLPGIYDFVAIYTSQNNEIQSAIISSSITIIGIMVTVVFASRQWKSDNILKHRIDVFGNIASTTHDILNSINQLEIFARHTEQLMIEICDTGKIQREEFEFKYWKKMRDEATEYEQKLWQSWGEFHRWSSIGKSHFIAVGVNNRVDNIAEIAASIKMQSQKFQIFDGDGTEEDVEFSINYINVYCLGVFIGRCETARTYISGNIGYIGDALLKSMKMYSFKELLFLLKTAPEMHQVVTSINSGAKLSSTKITQEYRRL